MPGPNHCYVRLMDTSLSLRRKKRKSPPPLMPTFYPEDADGPIAEEYFDETIFDFSEPSIEFALEEE